MPEIQDRDLFAGVDIGSTTSKATLIDAGGRLVQFSIIDTLYDRNASGEEVLGKALAESGRSRDDVRLVYSTGYGRRAFELTDNPVSEVPCHARGTVALYPGTRTIIDIGGQDVKLIGIDEHGIIDKFEMNDRCAAGTGRFFEVLSKRLLNVTLDELGPIAMKSKNHVLITSTCTVFAESEIVSYLSQGIPQEDIAMGILMSVARRVAGMSAQSRIPLLEPIVVSGGLARNEALRIAFEERFEHEVTLMENPQLPASLGAALMAKEAYLRQ